MADGTPVKAVQTGPNGQVTNDEATAPKDPDTTPPQTQPEEPAPDAPPPVDKPFVTIAVKTTEEVNGKTLTQAIGIPNAAGDGLVAKEIPAISESPNADNKDKLVYTVKLSSDADGNKPATSSQGDITVKVNFSGGATLADFEGAGGSKPVAYDGNFLKVVIPEGQSEVTFSFSAHQEPDVTNATFYEGNEQLVASLQLPQGEDKAQLGTDQVARGLIIDTNPISVAALSADVTPYYSFDAASSEEQPSVVVDGSVVNGVATRPVTTTEYDDSFYVGYSPDGTRTNLLGNISGLAPQGTIGTYTDGEAGTTTIDMAGGNDNLTVRGNMLAFTRVFLGEGDDTYNLFAGTLALRSLDSTARIYAEGGNDEIYIRQEVMAGKIYLGAGSDVFVLGTDDDFKYLSSDTNPVTVNTMRTNLTGTLDLGTGAEKADDGFLEKYQGGFAKDKPLGTVTMDTAEDINTVIVHGNVSGTINGGLGKDNVTAGSFSGSFNGGSGIDTLTITGGGNTISLANITGVELIDLTGTGNNTLSNVTVDNLANNSGLYVRGNVGDKVNVAGQGLIEPVEGFTNTGKTTTNEHDAKDTSVYNVWTDTAGHMLYIDQDINVI